MTATAITAQNCRLSGVCRDRGTRVPTELATIYINELAQGCFTDDKGSFEIKSIPTGTYQVRVSYLGYETVDTLILINKPAYLSFYLTKTSLQLK